MSTIFGLKRAPGHSVLEEDLLQLAKTTARWATEGTSVLASGHVGMGFQPYHTYARSRLESLPIVDAEGNMITFDGRLDNCEDLSTQLNLSRTEVSDSDIVMAAFERWGEACFSHLVGDWAIALWLRKTNTLYLARDHAGARTLYYERTGNDVKWSTFLETLVSSNGSNRLDSLFVNRYLTLLPLEETTPYAGVYAVPAGHYIVVSRDRICSTAHWSAGNKRELLLSDDREYEERFFQLFRRSVERRIDGGPSVLAHLSGGMDSTSIVCMADDVLRSTPPLSDMIDTVSFYDDSEISWDDDRYFPLVEKFRGKSGYHIRAQASRLSLSLPSSVYLFPGADGTAEEQENEFNATVGIDKYRIILSGLGGDEFMGGIPYPTPELASYLLHGRLLDLAQSGVSWGLLLRRPLIEVLSETFAFTANMIAGGDISSKQIFPWISKSGIALLADSQRSRCHAPQSAFRNYYLKLLAIVRESLPHLRPQATSRLEYRYPMLDRDLLDFLIHVPRNQLLRPGERRSLMKRAVGKLMPVEIMNRRRKAVVSQGPLRAIVSRHTEISSLFKESLLEALGFIDGVTLKRCLGVVVQGKDISFYPGIRKAIEMELWLRTFASTSQLQI
jgi:asparagine synthase (glutamine-hydrolysing)